MTELRKLIIECKNAVTCLAGCIEHYEIDIPLEFDLYEMREWFLVMQGYAKCLEDMEDKNKGEENSFIRDSRDT